jgi:hypothetical protein
MARNKPGELLNKTALTKLSDIRALACKTSELLQTTE